MDALLDFFDTEKALAILSCLPNDDDDDSERVDSAMAVISCLSDDDDDDDDDSTSATRKEAEFIVIDDNQQSTTAKRFDSNRQSTNAKLIDIDNGRPPRPPPPPPTTVDDDDDDVDEGPTWRDDLKFPKSLPPDVEMAVREELCLEPVLNPSQVLTADQVAVASRLCEDEARTIGENRVKYRERQSGAHQAYVEQMRTLMLVCLMYLQRTAAITSAEQARRVTQLVTEVYGEDVQRDSNGEIARTLSNQIMSNSDRQ